VAKRTLLLLVVALGALSWTDCSKKKEEKVAVPNLVNQNLDQAQKALTAAGLKTGNISGAAGAIPPGAWVTAHTPAAGQSVDPNSAVDLVVALPVMVPTLTNSNVADAVVLLQGLGLKVGFVKKSTLNPFGTGKVEQQDPAPNTPVRSGALVTLTVSTGPDIDISGLVGLVKKQPAYQNLQPDYKNVLDAFLGNPSTPRSMEPAQDLPTK
jgi:beta-lactam-binding protein with PASTA domain